MREVPLLLCRRESCAHECPDICWSSRERRSAPADVVVETAIARPNTVRCLSAWLDERRQTIHGAAKVVVGKSADCAVVVDTEGVFLLRRLRKRRSSSSPSEPSGVETPRYGDPPSPTYR